MCHREPPSRNEASTNVACRVLMTSERITQAKTATAEMPVAMAALVVSKPIAVTTMTASRKFGIAEQHVDQTSEHDVHPAAEKPCEEAE